MKILFFDTETTGVPKNYNAPISDLDNWPRLVQLAYMFFDGEELVNETDRIIKADGFTIPKEASNIHGITTEISIKKGIDCKETLEEFVEHLECADLLCAHNIAFDEKIIAAEIYRHNVAISGRKIPRACTMLMSVDLLKIPSSRGYKWPKLQELHNYLFGHDFDSAHNALNDIRATAKCYFELKKRGL